MAVTNNMLERNENKMEIKDASPEAVGEMINHIYSGVIPANIGDHVAELLHLSDKYRLNSLKRACEKTLVDDLVVDNAINLIFLADRWGDQF